MCLRERWGTSARPFVQGSICHKNKRTRSSTLHGLHKTRTEGPLMIPRSHPISILNNVVLFINPFRSSARKVQKEARTRASTRSESTLAEITVVLVKCVDCSAHEMSRRHLQNVTFLKKSNNGSMSAARTARRLDPDRRRLDPRPQPSGPPTTAA